MATLRLSLDSQMISNVIWIQNTKKIHDSLIHNTYIRILNVFPYFATVSNNWIKLITDKRLIFTQYL